MNTYVFVHMIGVFTVFVYPFVYCIEKMQFKHRTRMADIDLHGGCDTHGQ